MQKQVKDDPLAIPDFLKVANRGKKFKLPKVAPAAPKEEVILPQVTPEVMELIAAGIKSGRFRSHWMEDASTVRLFERRLHEEREAKEAKELERAAKKEANKAERELQKSLRPKFGLGIRIIVLVRDPKRQPGAARIPRFASLLKYLDKNPNASVADVFEHTEYIKSDFTRDQRLKIIKTDLITNKPAKKGK